MAHTTVEPYSKRPSALAPATQPPGPPKCGQRRIRKLNGFFARSCSNLVGGLNRAHMGRIERASERYFQRSLVIYDNAPRVF